MSLDLSASLAEHGLTRTPVLQLAFSAMVAVLFLQSGLDKVFNWRGERTFMTGHFEKSILKGWVPVMLPVVTVLELAAGSCSAIGFFSVLFGGGTSVGFVGMLLATMVIVLLFLGQRVAKDYKGAATLVPYFLLCAGGLFVWG